MHFILYIAYTFDTHQPLSAILARRGLTEGRARNVWRGSLRQWQDLTRVRIAFPARIQLLWVQQQIRRALGVRPIQARRRGARPWPTASASLARLALTAAHAPCVLQAHTRWRRETLRAPTA